MNHYSKLFISSIWKNLFSILAGTFSLITATAQVSLVKDINQYASAYTNSDPKDFVLMGNEIYFVAESNNNRTLWKSDGTSSGTIALNGPTLVSKLTVVDDELFCIGYDSSHGYELWKTDGTQLGTVLVKDIQPGGNDGNIQILGVFNNELWFNANNGSSGQVLWKSDGTDVGTVIVNNQPSAYTTGSVLLNGLMYFSSLSTGNNYNLFVTDGSTSGTYSISTSASGLSEITLLDTLLIFAASGNGLGIEIWKSDGTDLGTTMLKDIRVGSNDSYPNSLTVLNDQVFFFAMDATNGYEIWKTDGTITGTSLAVEITPGSSVSPYLSTLVSYHDSLFFIADSPIYGVGLFKSDGTTAGTIFVGSLESGTSFFLENNGLLYFTNNSSGLGIELWVTDGTSAGTHVVKDIYPGNSSSDVNAIGKFNNQVFFGANNGQFGKELWTSDGTLNGTTLFKDVNNPTPSSPKLMTSIGNELFFVADSANTPNILWKTDGTEAGTQFVKQIDLIGQYPQYEIFPYNNQVLFGKEGSVSDATDDLFVSDGTSGGTHSLMDICQFCYSYPKGFKELNGQVYFVARLSSGIQAIFKTDGTTSGTSQVISGVTQFSDFGFTEGEEIFNKLGNALYFKGLDGELWKTDGTTSGTYRVKDINISAESNPMYFKEYNGNLYFLANDGIHGRELWRTDGTELGTVLVLDLGPGSSASSDIYDFDVFNGDLLIAYSPSSTTGDLLKYNSISNSSTSIHSWTSSGPRKIYVLDTIAIVTVGADLSSNKLWRTNGVTCEFVKNTMPYSYSNGPEKPLAVDNYLFFTQVDSSGYYQLWRTDGSTCGTTRLSQFNSGPGGTIFDLKVMNGDIYFDNDVEDYSRELWKYNYTDPIVGETDSSICLNSSITWNGIIISDSGTFCQSFLTSAGIDSIAYLHVTVDTLEIAINSLFSMPSDINSCTGELAVTMEGSDPYELNIDSQVLTSNGYSLVTGLCPGVHDLQITDNCGDTLSVPVVIPVDSNFVFNNLFIDSLAQDSLGVTLTNCDIYYNGIDTAYIDSIWATGNTVNVIWNIVDSNGSNFDTTSYVLNNGNGVYWLQLSVFCPNKSLGEYFTVTEAIYFNNGSVSTAGLPDYEQALFEVYPNPTNDQIHISFSGPEAELTVYDLQGKVVLKDRIQNQEVISLQNFERGVYLFDFQNPNGQQVRRVVKQ